MNESFYLKKERIITTVKACRMEEFELKRRRLEKSGSL
jgi:hypothetical protein